MGTEERRERRARPADVERRTGLTRRQTRYCESRGYLGHVERAENGVRIFNERQIRFLELLATFRAGGIRLEEAAELAAEEIEGGNRLAEDRLDQLAARTLTEADRSLRTVLAIWKVVRRRMERESAA